MKYNLLKESNMKNILQIILLTLIAATGVKAQNVLGKWTTIDDNTGKARSTVEIFERDGKVYGKIIAITDPTKRDRVCEKCSGDDRNRPLIGLEIIKGLEKNGEKYENGYITDPDTGKRYKCYIELQDAKTLKVRGFIGMSILGRTQIWQRTED